VGTRKPSANHASDLNGVERVIRRPCSIRPIAAPNGEASEAADEDVRAALELLPRPKVLGSSRRPGRAEILERRPPIGSRKTGRC